MSEQILRDTAKETASIMFIVCASSLYGYLLTRTRLPAAFMNAIFTVTQNKIIILLLLNVFFLVIGCFMETNAALIILVPILTPMATALGIDLLHLGVMIVLNLMIGQVTPPFGVCLFVISDVNKVRLESLYKSILPFLIPLIATLALAALPALAANDPVTLIGSHTANLAFHPMAFAFVTRPLTSPGGVESYVTHYNGVSLRVVRGYDMQHKWEMLSMDVLYGFKTLYPELAVRILG